MPRTAGQIANSRRNRAAKEWRIRHPFIGPLPQGFNEREARIPLEPLRQWPTADQIRQSVEQLPPGMQVHQTLVGTGLPQRRRGESRDGAAARMLFLIFLEAQLAAANAAQ